MHSGIRCALLAALLFGASTPFASLLSGRIAPLTLAGLLYAGSGCGLALWLLLRGLRACVGKRANATTPIAVDAPPSVPPTFAGLQRADLPWLAGAILCGGVAGPVLLMIGLLHTPAASASLLLNMEGVLSAVIAWCVSRENVDRRVFLGMLCIVAAGALLSWDGRAAGSLAWGAAPILGACLCWAIDNNLTRRVSTGDPVQIACIKGLAAGGVNLTLAALCGLPSPPILPALGAALIGFGGYGLSLVLFVLALRGLGSARTGAWFGIAPFAGAAVSLPLSGDMPPNAFWVAAGLMGLGLWLHLRETHLHAHVHEPLLHAHAHAHGEGDPHHDHVHAPDWDGVSPHSHAHQHVALEHSHVHYPDIHHRHRH